MRIKLPGLFQQGGQIIFYTGNENGRDLSNRKHNTVLNSVGPGCTAFNQSINYLHDFSDPSARAKPPPRISSTPHGHFSWTDFQSRSFRVSPPPSERPIGSAGSMNMRIAMMTTGVASAVSTSIPETSHGFQHGIQGDTSLRLFPRFS